MVYANVLSISKMIAFSDDTTIILVGSPTTLKAAWTIPEMYGSVSRLKMNPEKKRFYGLAGKNTTKKNRYNYNLDWNCTEF